MFRKMTLCLPMAGLLCLIMAITAPMNCLSETRDAKKPLKEFKKDETKKVDREPQVDLQKLSKDVVYPEKAKKAGIEGRVMVKAFVDKDGKVTKTKIESTDNKILNNAAIKAVKSAKFKPAMLDNKAVSAWVVLPISFKLKDK